jgi:hypothetical protein
LIDGSDKRKGKAAAEPKRKKSRQQIETETPASTTRSTPRTRGGHTQPTPRQRRAAVEQMVELEHQAHPIQGPELPSDPWAEAFNVFIRDLRNLLWPKIRRLRSMAEDEWFPHGREDSDPRFWTILQESIYASYV